MSVIFLSYFEYNCCLHYEFSLEKGCAANDDKIQGCLTEWLQLITGGKGVSKIANK